MTDFETAKQIAARAISKIKVAPGIELVLLEDKIIERPFGWVFRYNSKKFLETGDYRDSVLGNAPLIIDRRDGSVHLTKTAPPIDFYIEKYEREHPFEGAETASASAVPATPVSPATVSTPPVHTTQPTTASDATHESARHESRRPVVALVATVVAALALGFIAMFGWLRYRHGVANSVPVLAQYAPKDPHSMIRAVSLSSSMNRDFDTARVGTKFDKGISSVALWYRWANATRGQILEISWSRDDSEVLRQRVSISKTSGEQAYALRTPNGSPLPEGSYQVTLIEAGKPVTTIPFQIGNPRPLKPTGAGVCENGSSEPGCGIAPGGAGYARH
jgi:hypothetical protein